MTRRIAFALALGLAGQAAAAPQRHLGNEVNALIKQVADALASNENLKGKTFKLGRFSSDDRPDSQYGPELRRQFEQALTATAELKGRLIPDGALTVVVGYDLLDADKDTLADGRTKLRVLQIEATILEGKKPLFGPKSVEVNDTADIYLVFGFTGAPPGDNQDERNKTVPKEEERTKNKAPDQIKPSFQVKNNTRVGVKGDDKFFVEILVKDKADGPATVIAPKPNALGNAFVDIKPGQFYEIVVHNDDRFDCVAKITIDGQDAANRFNVDGVAYTGLAVAPGKSAALAGWLHTVKPRLKEKDNVFAFAVKEYYPGAGKEVPKPGEVGVITVQFALAWPKGTERPTPKGRQVGRITEKGQPLLQDFEVKEMEHAEFNETVSIRYSPTAK